MLHPVGDKHYIETIEVNKRVLPVKIVQASGVNATELYKLNPALRNTNYPILEGYHLLVPKHDAQLLSMTINNLPEDILPVWGQHEITTGESLSGIARRYGTSVVVLQQANNLHGDIIVAGPAWGRVRAMFSHDGSSIEKVQPSSPIEVMGLDTVPRAGDMFNSVESARKARVQVKEYSAASKVSDQNQVVVQ